MLPLKPPYNILHFINILHSQKICTFRDIDPFLHQHPIFSAFSNLNFFYLKNLKIQTLQIPSSSIIPNPNWTKIAQKIQNWSSSRLTMKLLYTYFWKTLPVGDLIWLALIWLTFSKSSHHATHLKSPEKNMKRHVLFLETWSKPWWNHQLHGFNTHTIANSCGRCLPPFMTKIPEACGCRSSAHSLSPSLQFCEIVNKRRFKRENLGCISFLKNWMWQSSASLRCLSNFICHIRYEKQRSTSTARCW